MSRRLPRGFDTPVCIGEGGFGSVYRARQTRLDRHLVIKMLRIPGRRRREHVYREARTHADIAIPGTPRIYDVFQHRDAICIVMEWIRAIDLRRFLLTDPPPHVRMAVAGSLVRAVAAFHAHGFAHRDLKPSNVLLSPDTGMHLIDFGLSRRADGPRHAEQTGTLAGTPRYLAPELLDAAVETHDYRRADMYSLGVMLEEVLDGDGPAALVAELTAHDPGRRPPDMAAVCRRWDEEGGVAETAAWTGACGAATASITSQRLVKGARDLLRRGRFDEAYRLTLESLREAPDHPEAMALLQSFHATVAARKRRSVFLRTGLAAAGVAVLAALAVLSLRDTTRVPSAVMARSPRAGVASLSFAPPPEASTDPGPGTYRLRMETMKTLTGTIVVRPPDRHTRVLIDGVVVPEATRDRVRITVPGGPHRIGCVREDGSVWTRRVRLAPFQKVCLSVPQSEGGTP